MAVSLGGMLEWPGMAVAVNFRSTAPFSVTPILQNQYRDYYQESKKLIRKYFGMLHADELVHSIDHILKDEISFVQNKIQFADTAPL